MKFNHLNVPDSWKHYWTRYPEGYTIIEALISWVSQVDSMTDNVNNWNEYLDNFVATFDKELQQTVTDTLSDWQSSGFIDVVISAALQWELDDYKATNEQDKLSLITQLEQTNTDVLGRGINIMNPPSPLIAAKLDGVTDDTAALKGVLSYLQNTGGDVIIPSGTLRFTSKIVVPDRVNIKGMGMTEAEEESTHSRPTRLLKDGDFDGIDLRFASSISDLSIDGALNNTGYGVKLNGNRARLENVAVTKMGGHGVVVGDDEIDGNRNYWRLINVTSRVNGGYGFIIDDLDPGYGPDANAGYAEQCNAFTNGTGGWAVASSAVCTFVQCYAESNKGNGWTIKNKAKRNTFLNCGSEQNTGEQFVFDNGSVNNLLFGSFDFKPVDNGANVALFSSGGAIQNLFSSRVVNSSTTNFSPVTSVTDGFKASGNVPGVVLYETDAVANKKQWDIIANGGKLAFRTSLDNGSSPNPFINVFRGADGSVERVFVTPKLIAHSGLGVGNFASASTLGTVTRKMEVFNADGQSIGFVPIYNTIT